MKTVLLTIWLVVCPLAALGEHSNENHCLKLLSTLEQKNKQPELSTQAAEVLYQDLKRQGFSKQQARGYAILISAMVLSAATTTYLTSSLPQNFQFLSHFIAQVSTLGVYVLGAPIWEPLSSRFRKMAFGVHLMDSKTEDPGFESLWRKTQENYSLNAQMSRNVIIQFIISVQQNFYEAYRATRSNDPEYAANQIAEAAYRLKHLFKEISPTDQAVATVVHSAFSNHLDLDEDFESKVLEKITAFEKQTLSPEQLEYYSALLKTWLKRT